MRQSTFWSVTEPSVHHFFTVKLSYKYLVKRQLTSPSHLKCAATLPCDLSLIMFQSVTIFRP